MPGDLNLIVDRGATFQLHLAWSDDEEEIDLTEAVAVMKVRPRQGRTDPVDLDPILVLRDAAAVAPELNAITLGGTAGTIDVELSALQTEDLAVGKYVYDLLITFPIGTVVKLVEGSFLVRNTVSL